MRISVIVPHLNQPDHLARCLAALNTNTIPPDEIIVVDNGSQALPAQICAAFENVTLVSERTPGPGPARNHGVSVSTGEILAFIDADCIADASWLQKMKAALLRGRAEIVGGDVRIGLSNPPRMSQVEAYESLYAFRMQRYIEKEGYAGAGNMAVTRKIVAKVGPFKGLETAEDRDWGQRATRLGFRIAFIPDAIVYHPARPSMEALRQKWARHITHEYNASRETHLGRWKFAAKTAAMPFSPIAEVPRIILSDRLPNTSSRLKAFVGLFRIRLYRFRFMLRQILTRGPIKSPDDWNRTSK